MTIQDTIRQSEHWSLAERIQIIEYLLRSVKDEIRLFQNDSAQTVQKPSNAKPIHNLAALAGLVSGDGSNVSERIEDILLEDINPVSGLSIDR